jgi:hypothetical protein
MLATLLLLCVTGGSTTRGADSQAAAVEPIRVFLSRVEPPVLGEIAALSAGTKLKESPADPSRVELVSSKGRLAVRRVAAEETAKQERELVGAVATDRFENKRDELYDLYERLLHTRHVFEITPQSGRAMRASAQDLARRFAASMKGIVLDAGVVTDPEGRRLFAPGQAPDPAATIPRFESAMKRRAATRAHLAKKGVTIPNSHSLILADEEVTLRDGESVIDRCRGLRFVTALASGIRREAGSPTAEVHALLTPAERYYCESDSRDEEMRQYFCSQSEALFALLWALGAAPELSETYQPVDPKVLAAALEPLVQDDFRAGKPGLALRPRAEILDAADGAWCVNRAEFEGMSPDDGGLWRKRLGVSIERCRALFWLIRHRDLDWDDVGRDT